MVVHGSPLRIAIIGAGISGITAAHILSRKHNVELFERNQYLGGHTNTRVIDGEEDCGAAIDTGFIVCNRRNYPNFYKFLSQLGIKLQNSHMSFGFYSEATGLQYMGPSIAEFLAVPRNFLKADFLAMILEQRRFNRHVLSDLRAGKLGEESLGVYLQRLGSGRFFIEHYVMPLVAAIWSTPDVDSLNFPMATFARFFENHGMLELSKRPQWQTVVGGSHSYIREFAKVFTGKIHLDCPVNSIARENGQVIIRFRDRPERFFDKVIVATHADEALSLLEKPETPEKEALGAWRYSRNRVVLHTDSSIMRGPKRLWASWNYRRRAQGVSVAPVFITYYMNRLQGLKTKRDYFVSLNLNEGIRPDSVIYETEYTHPVYTEAAVRSQKAVRKLNGHNNTFYCGAHMYYGFHEDGVRSALDVTQSFGMEL